MGFVTCFLNRTSQEIKPKSNESTNSGTKTEGMKSLSQQKVFVTRFLNGASQEIKAKIKQKSTTEILQVKQLKENSTENSAEKNFKED